MKKVLLAIDRGLFLSVAALLSTVMLTMVLLAFLQVVLRNLFDTGIPWADVALRHMVLWIGMLGGLLATRQGRQISIDLLTRTRNKALRTMSLWAGSLFTIAVTFFLARVSLQFVIGEKEFGSTLYGNFPSWIVQAILPVGFALIGFQVLLNLALGRVRAGPAELEVPLEGVAAAGDDDLESENTREDRDNGGGER